MSGGRGKCVDILHVMGDMICQLGKPPMRPQLDLITNVVDQVDEAVSEDINSTDFTSCPITEESMDNLEQNIESINLMSNEDNIINGTTDLVEVRS